MFALTITLMVYGTLNHHVYSCKIKKNHCNQHE